MYTNTSLSQFYSFCMHWVVQSLWNPDDVSWKNHALHLALQEAMPGQRVPTF